MVTGRLRFALLVVGLIAVSTLVVHAYGKLKQSRRALASPAPAMVATPSPAARALVRTGRQEQQSQPLDTILVTINPRGFDSSQITAPAHPFYLLVDNRSGLSTIALRLDQVSGPRLRSVDVPQEQLDWADVVDLAPGEYLLTEANHPDWSCHITLTVP